MKHRISRFAFAALLALALLVPVLPLISRAQEATPATGLQIVADGIANPRGFTWGADGTMFLAVSGTGGDNPGPEGSPFSGGDTASVVVVRDSAVTTLAAGLPSSVWRDIDWVWGVMDVAILGDQLYALVGGGGAIHGNPDTPSGVYRSMRMERQPSWRIWEHGSTRIQWPTRRPRALRTMTRSSL